MKNSDWQTKLLLALVAALLTMAGWYLRETSKEMREMRLELMRVSVKVEVLAGGDVPVEEP